MMPNLEPKTGNTGKHKNVHKMVLANCVTRQKRWQKYLNYSSDSFPPVFARFCSQRLVPVCRSQKNAEGISINYRKSSIYFLQNQK